MDYKIFYTIKKCEEQAGLSFCENTVAGTISAFLNGKRLGYTIRRERTGYLVYHATKMNTSLDTACETREKAIEYVSEIVRLGGR